MTLAGNRWVNGTSLSVRNVGPHDAYPPAACMPSTLSESQWKFLH